MINATIISLNVLSMISSSPFYTLYNTHQGNLKTSFINSHFSRSFTSVIISYTQKHQTMLHNSIFTNMMDSAIRLANDDLDCLLHENEQFVPGSPIIKQKIYGDNYTIEGHERPYFKKNCGDITITQCEFHNCHSTSEGGSIHIQQECTVLIHDTIFDKTSSSSRYGGAVYLVQTKKTGDNFIDFVDDMLPSVDIQYCCFQDCYADEKEKLYGIACFIAGNQTILYYASTVNCPGLNKERNLNAGAQFDIQAINVTSQYVNATGGYSKFCAAIEYRTATNGFFKFQTISDMDCMFAVSYTSIVMEGLDLSLSNIMNVTLKKYDKQGESAFSGLIHVRGIKTLVISDFSFIDNNFNTEIDDQSRLISKGYNQEITVKLINCYYSCGDDLVDYNYQANHKTRILVDCHPSEDYTNDIPQLDLGDCKGRVTPAPLIPPTDAFTESNEFSQTVGFSKTNGFSNTNYFSQTNDFSNSNEFTKTAGFTKTTGFSETNDFSNSNEFTETAGFTKTDGFSETAGFTKTDGFSKTNDFSNTNEFLKTSEFSKSNEFSESKGFSKSRAFQQTSGFTHSNEFSKSNHFTKSQDFAQTKEFTQSNGFSQSSDFAKTKEFTDSNKFTKSNEFSESSKFTSSSTFTQSSPFTSSDKFSKSKEFSKSSVFSNTKSLAPVLLINDSDKGKNKSVPIIAGVVAGVAAAAIIAALVAFFIIKKKRSNVSIPEEVETITDDDNNSINNVNPIYDNNAADDPFKEDFVA